MKKLLWTLLILIFIFIGFLLWTNYEKANNAPHAVVAAPQPIAMGNGTYCFMRHQVATDVLPYTVDEHIVLNIVGNKVTGTKTGMQSGPDMTNGYTGTLIGTKTDNTIEATYSYTVEGSKNKELEVYKWDGDSLVKSRWPLVEENQVLVPDKVGNSPTLITYTKEMCLK